MVDVVGDAWIAAVAVIEMSDFVVVVAMPAAAVAVLAMSDFVVVVAMPDTAVAVVAMSNCVVDDDMTAAADIAVIAVVAV